MHRLTKTLFTALTLICLCAGLASAKDIVITWDPSPSEDLAGYKVYYGTNPGTYDGSAAVEGLSPIDIGTSTTLDFVGLDNSENHYFAVTAYNYSGEESVHSNEVLSPVWSYEDYDADGYDQTVDCDDYDAKINPGATEIHNNDIDENCNGMDDDVLIVAPAGAIEAENGNLTAPMGKIADSAASGGYYIQTTVNQSGLATYNFNVTTSGVYKFVARSFMPDGSADSFYVDIDGQGEFTWYLTTNIYNAWHENEITNMAEGIYTAELTAGNHSITVRGREANAKIDYLYSVKVGEIASLDVDNDGYDVNSDCNDNDPAINPAANEIPYNGIDENCNNMTDDDDLDQDGFATADDCNDNDQTINPAANEIPYNAIDENCNGMDDDVLIVAPAGAIEAENGNLTAPMGKIADSAASGGYYIQTTVNQSGLATYNFNVTTSGVYKFVARSFMPDGSADSFYVDIDGQGEFTWYLTTNIYNAWHENEITNMAEGIYTAELTAGNHSITVRGREANAKIDYLYSVKVGEIASLDVDNDGYDVNSDCNDNDPAINPAANEIPYNGIDENCNNMTDDDDLDQDGFATADDCNDNDQTINPAANEIPYNAIDENCNGMGDDDDLDQDGFATADDCNDNDQTINPAANEIPYNAIDENCNGMGDDDDLDQDGFATADDCNDNDQTINPAANEIPYNAIDENCNGMGDDDDLDQDGFATADDCNDNDQTINPAANEIPYNAIDENCNGMGDDAMVIAPSGAIEAENGNLTAPMQKVPDSAASGGYYIQTTANLSGLATYSFNVTTPGVYKFVARSLMPSSSADSFYVDIDGQGEFTWYLTTNIYNTWNENEITNKAEGIYTAGLTAGSHSITIRGREANAKIDYIRLIKVAELPSGPVRIEAESGTLSSPMQAVQDLAVSGGSYISSTSNNAGTASYAFDIDVAGSYKIVAQVFAADKATDSFYVNIDNKGEVIWDLNPTEAASEFNLWRKDDVTNRGTGTYNAPQFDPYIIDLNSGSHTITLRCRESGTRLDYLEFVKE